MTPLGWFLIGVTTGAVAAVATVAGILFWLACKAAREL
jgi:hypothetical protein